MVFVSQWKVLKGTALLLSPFSGPQGDRNMVKYPEEWRRHAPCKCGLLSCCSGTLNHRVGGGLTSTTYQLASIKEFQRQTEGSCCNHGWREVNHVVTHNAQLHQVLGQNVLFSLPAVSQSRILIISRARASCQALNRKKYFLREHFQSTGLKFKWLNHRTLLCYIRLLID